MGLSDDPIGYINLAKKLSGLEFDPKLKHSNERTIVGRIYYGVFAYLKLKLYPSDKEDKIGHNKLRNDAQRQVVKNGLDFPLKDQLKTLEIMREHADYYRKMKIDVDSVRKAWQIYEILEYEFSKIWPD